MLQYQRINILFALVLIFARPAGAADPVPIEIRSVTANIHMLVGRGGNIAVSSGEDGLFMIDDQYDSQSAPITTALETLNTGQPKFIVNTHWHRDHTGGNDHFEARGAIILAHNNVRERMSSAQFIEFFKAEVAPAPQSALPILTFNDQLRLHINDDEITVTHAPNAHTDGDAIVHFKYANVIHMGDVFFEGMYPFIDASSGGTVVGIIAAIENTLAVINEETKIIPGHGPLSDKAGLKAYQKMLATVHKRIADRIIAGETEAQVVSAQPTREFDEKYASGFIKADNFVRLIYQNIVHTTLN